jgi:hypothetical protein
MTGRRILADACLKSEKKSVFHINEYMDILLICKTALQK